MKKLSSLLIATLSVFLAYGCASVYSTTPASAKLTIDKHLVARNYCAADVLISQAKLVACQPISAACQPILIATIVDIDNLEHSTTFGRVTSENLSTRFTQAGFKVIEMKFSKSVYMKKDEGELVLTREITSIARDHNVQAVVVGTYAKGYECVYLNVKLVIPNSNIISASFDYTIPYDDEIKTLINY